MNLLAHSFKQAGNRRCFQREGRRLRERIPYPFFMPLVVRVFRLPPAFLLNKLCKVVAFRFISVTRTPHPVNFFAYSHFFSVYKKK